MSYTTLWTKGPEEAPLYSDWKVSFTATGSDGFVGKDGKDQDAGSVSTMSLSSDDSVSEKSPPEPQEASYAVHRNIIGPKSVFFTQSFSKGQDKSSTIALPSNLPSRAFSYVVEAFELLLDYCYITGSNEKFSPESKMTTENAVALFCLCNYFGMDSDICGIVRTFIKSDLNHDTVAKYYQVVKDLRSTHKGSASMVLDATPILDMVVIMCHQCPQVLQSKTDLFEIADLSLWLSVGSLIAQDDKGEEEGTRSDTSKVWSENLTDFFDLYKEDGVLDLKDSFRTLTAENILPEVSSKVALRLLEHERKLGLSDPKHPASKEASNEASDSDSEEGHSRATSHDDSTIATTDDSDLDAVFEAELSGTSKLTSLQKRCVQALCESNWSGEENDVEQKRGKLVAITTPAVLEALLIDSVNGERTMQAKMEEMKTEVETEKKELADKKDAFEFNLNETKMKALKEQQKQQSLQQKLNKVTKDLETVQRKLKKVAAKAEEEKEKLCKANAKIEAELDSEKKRSYSLDLRYRAMETAHNKTETDREMLELTLKDTIKRLGAMNSVEQEAGCFGMGTLILLVSAMSDRMECDQIRAMLQQVVKDPMSYERDYLIKDQADQDTLAGEDTVGGDDTIGDATSCLTGDRDDFDL